MFCSKCGAQNLDGSKFCNKCGEKLVSTADSAVEQPVPTTKVPRYIRKTDNLGKMSESLSQKKAKKSINLQPTGNGHAQLSGDYYSVDSHSLTKVSSQYFNKKVNSKVTGLVDVYSFSGQKNMVRSSVSKTIDLKSVSDVYILAPDFKKRILVNVFRVIGGISLIIFFISMFRGLLWLLLFLISFVISMLFTGKKFTAIHTPDGDYTVGDSLVVPYVEDMIEAAQSGN